MVRSVQRARFLPRLPRIGRPMHQQGVEVLDCRELASLSPYLCCKVPIRAFLLARDSTAAEASGVAIESSSKQDDSVDDCATQLLVNGFAWSPDWLPVLFEVLDVPSADHNCGTAAERRRQLVSRISIRFGSISARHARPGKFLLTNTLYSFSDRFQRRASRVVCARHGRAGASMMRPGLRWASSFRVIESQRRSSRKFELSDVDYPVPMTVDIGDK